MMLPSLKKYRILAGLTQEELAERVGMHRVSIVELEGGKRSPHPRTLKKLAEVLGVDTETLTKNGGRS